MKQIDHYVKVKKSDIAFLGAYLEAFEGMCAMRTPDPKPGEDAVMHFMVSPDFAGQYEDLMNSLAKEIQMEEVEP